MPIYDYQCETCGQHFEISHKMSQSAPPHGPGCSRPDCDLVKQLSAPAGIVKGANPFVTKCGKPLPDESGCANAAAPKNTESAHSCQTGCALHSH
jgi:putative FmdB family regulatory protein